MKFLTAALGAASLIFGGELRAADMRPCIVCFGDSLTSCGGKGGRYSDMLQKSLPEYRFVNSGKGGDTIGGALARLDDAVLRCRPFAVVIGIGANDYWRRQRPLAELKRDYESIVKRCSQSPKEAVPESAFRSGLLIVPSGRKIYFLLKGRKKNIYDFCCCIRNK